MQAPLSDDLNGLCRDCFCWQHVEVSTSVRLRCKECGGPRVLVHNELANLHFAHIDCDAFFASVEKRDDPSLEDKPLIVGGGKRGVVSTCCYLARIHGVRSAQPMFKALAACPDAVVIPPNGKKYSVVGKDIRERMRALTPLVEPLSIDEAFLDLSGTERLHGCPPAEVLARFARTIEDEVGVSVSVGLSFNKFLAKVASDFDKPRGFFVIGREKALPFLAEQPVSMIWGVGKVLQRKLERDGYSYIGDLQKADEETLAKAYGTIGLRLYRLSRADDTRTVKTERAIKSVSSETTFRDDIRDLRDLTIKLRGLSEKVSAQLKTKDISGQTVTLKLKTADFKNRTRSHTLPDPTQLADRIFREGLALLEHEVDGTPFRLIGIGVRNLYPSDAADPLDFFQDGQNQRAKAERAIDSVRERFGKDAVKLGLMFDNNAKH